MRRQNCCKTGHGVTRIGNTLYVYTGFNVARPSFDRYNLTTASPRIEYAARVMRDAVGLACPPDMYLVESAHGAGGVYYGHANVIVVGVEDAIEIAVGIWQRHRLMIRLLAWRYGVRTRRDDDIFAFLFDSVVSKIFAHELGHAHAAIYGLAAPFTHPEAAADSIAGELDAIRGGDPELGRIVFSEIGCTGQQCTHPTPVGRAYAYLYGYVLQPT